jgi:Holliday junction resolvasome RuvABC endonuclease subunit
MERVLGIDQSYNNCGFVMKDEANAMIDFGTFKSAKASDIYDRARQIAGFVADKAVEHNAKRIHIEGLAFGIRGDATRDLAGLLFTIITTLRNRNINVEVEIIAPTSLKKFATGSGKSDKAAMITAVPAAILEKFTEAKYKKSTGLADLCDAYWLSQFKA